MGARKRNAANAKKEARKTQYFATLQNVPSSPRKMRYVVDLIRGMEVGRALGTLPLPTGSRRMIEKPKLANCM